MSIIHQLEDAASESLDATMKYIRGDDGADKDKALASLKLISSYSRVRATRANEAAVLVAAGKMAGVGDQGARQIFDVVQDSLLPAGHERLSVAPQVEPENQGVKGGDQPEKPSARKTRQQARKR